MFDSLKTGKASNKHTHQILVYTIIKTRYDHGITLLHVSLCVRARSLDFQKLEQLQLCLMWLKTT